MEGLLSTGPTPSSCRTVTPSLLIISILIELQQQQRLQNQVGSEEVRERARLASRTLPHAGDWLNPLLLISLGLHLRPVEFILVAKYQLGVEFYDKSGPCPVPGLPPPQ